MGCEYVMEVGTDIAMRQQAIGRENSANASLQLKHQWRSLILNAGLRYDHKHRFDDSDANEWSPRIAIILLQPKWNMKFSYSKSFVDAPYFYRVGNLMQGILQDELLMFVEGLEPERMHSWQLSFAGSNWLKGLHFEVNGFYNRGSDLITTNFINYENAARNYTAGAELMAKVMRDLREQPPAEIAGFAVENRIDYAHGMPMPTVNAREDDEPQVLPDANVIEFDLCGGNKVIVRPSGTEPKIKSYLFANADVATDADTTLEHLSASVRDILG
jgi:outer membrane cobalamin receptor